MGSLDNFFEDLKQVKATVKVKPKPKKSKPKEATPSNVYTEELSEVKDSNCPVCGVALSDLTFAVVSLQYASQTTLEEKAEAVFCTERLSIKPNGMGGYWGGGKRFMREDLGQLFPYLMKWREGLFSKPYIENLENARRFSNLKAEHIFINVSEGTVKWIEQHSGKSWEEFLKEWNAIGVRPIPDGYVELVDREHELEKNFETVRKEISDIQWGFSRVTGSARFDLDHPKGVKMAVEKLGELEGLLPIKIRLEGQLECVKEEIQELLEGE